MKNWTISQSRDLYNIQHWGNNYFGINACGHVCIHPPEQPDQSIDLYELALHIHREKGMRWPLLIRFVDILHDRVQRLQQAFNQALADCKQTSQFTAIYPIKVNQQRSVVEELLAGGGQQIGLEAGSKPELMAVLGTAPKGHTIICNGYKDREYLRLALIGRQMGHQIYIVVEKPSELTETLEESAKLDIEPLLGVRVRLYSLGKGKWQNTGGEKSKFGLSAAQTLQMLATLKNADKLACLQLLHFHMGSQIANIQDIQRGMREASRYFAELHQLGAPIQVVDVGGGLGVDYEGSRSQSDCSINYTMQEYANVIVRSVLDTCEHYRLPMPDFMTESGRGMTAHHALLVTNVIGTDPDFQQPEPELTRPEADAPAILHNLYRLYHNKTGLPASEIYHSASFWLSEAHSLYAHGVIDLQQRAAAEEFSYAISRQLLENPEYYAALDQTTQRSLRDRLADKYFCNFSLFQSMPDVWGIEQIFPIMPLQQLDEYPSQRATLQDMTCDSDGTIEQYVNGQTLDNSLALHPVKAEQTYLLGFFMLGAYQEILGDLHNLFGDTDSINVKLEADGNYRLTEPERGDTIDELLRYVHFEPKNLLARCRQKLAATVDDAERQKMLLREIEAGLIGYTYLED